ncbi:MULTISPECIES: LysR family transcriptional regulator [unclassified Lysobacter]|uniref:LysR family transcriptional regulator n=1 Tax=unclassified Lysobacter TaxID=2635362 RepID=UPI001BE6A12C|nr:MULTISPECIES: LysR family transcriptional regulator [unclassified Lysobacter]MBT2745272.1 LysR family transcriptional regulator [Lysobacter sp. ISL-42]MBT2751869.1 LysR family transcriptional regulator [Lysobacter sp. ISL-50]MBT2777834.1 LysR family transcriptional regulator [Lysobacter sp. ISL-54]MBT2783090.1 LysR family transcriptional regulator [Lysobacter sp. ISL-52]
MDRFEALRLFTRIVELGSFTRAAAVLDVPKATATHAIKELEARLGVRLLDRTTRQVRPTLDGQAYYDRCVHVLAELDDAESALSAVASNPRGTLRLDLHGTHATGIILPRINEFRGRYPQIDLEISSGDRLVDLVREGIDCVVRSGVPRDSSLVAKRLATMPEVVCASPEYLQYFGTPRHPDELSAHQAVGFFASNRDLRYPFELTVDGRLREYQLNSWISVNDAACYVAAALRGCGLIQLPLHGVEQHIREGRLVEVLHDYASPGVPVSVLYPQHRQLSPRVRVFVDWVAGVFADKFGADAPA